MTTLDELRRANLQEQRRSAQTQAPAAARPEPTLDLTSGPEPAAPPVAKAAPAPQAPPPAKAVPVAPPPPAVVAPERPAPASPSETPPPPVSVARNEPGQVPAPSSSPALSEAPPAPAPVSAPSKAVEPDEVRRPRAVMERFHRSLSRKIVHPTGVKATVDMPPDLFWRVKRYCHDHNNVTVRQLFLDLVIALLDEEGY